MTGNVPTEPPPCELVLLVGLQGSGKSSFYRARFSFTHVLVSKDLFPNNRNKARRQAHLVREALQEGRSVVVDNTNPTRADRADLIALGKEFRVRTVGYFFTPDVPASLERNRSREGKARVPDLAVFATFKRLERPTFAEGFDALFEVNLTSDFEFHITTWTTEEAP